MKVNFSSWRMAATSLALALMMSACPSGIEDAPRTFVDAEGAALGEVDRLLVGPGVAVGQVTVDRLTIPAGENAFASARVAAGTVTIYVVSGSVFLTAAELESTLEANQVATFAAGLEHQMTADESEDAVVFIHTANPSERRTDGED